ncbi:MAG: DUF397 domain-containing protein [Actinomycetes bacterium]
MRPTSPADASLRHHGDDVAAGQRVEITAWRKSSHSNPAGNCIEVGKVPGGVAVRDGKNPDGPILTFSRDAWRAFLDAVRSGTAVR